MDEGLVKKYGLVAAVLIYLDNKVDREKNYEFPLQYELLMIYLKNLNLKEIDIAPFGYYLVLQNARHMELITPFNINYFAILQPYPDEISRLDVVMRPFKLPVRI